MSEVPLCILAADGDTLLDMRRREAAAALFDEPVADEQGCLACRKASPP